MEKLTDFFSKPTAGTGGETGSAFDDSSDPY